MSPKTAAPEVETPETRRAQRLTQREGLAAQRAETGQRVIDCETAWQLDVAADRPASESARARREALADLDDVDAALARVDALVGDLDAEIAQQTAEADYAAAVDVLEHAAATQAKAGADVLPEIERAKAMAVEAVRIVAAAVGKFDSAIAIEDQARRAAEFAATAADVDVAFRTFDRKEQQFQGLADETKHLMFAARTPNPVGALRRIAEQLGRAAEQAVAR